MVKFVAKKPVDMTDLTELDLLADPLDVDFVHRESDSFTAKSGDVRLDVEGSGFRYLLKVPTPVGTITRIEAYESGHLAYKLSGFRFKFDKLIAASDFEKVVLEIVKGDDKLKGSSGDDVLTGGKGRDKLLGKDGDDLLKGQKGKDVLTGGEGDDRLDGGRGKDTYFFKAAPGSGIDTIVDFQKGEAIQIRAKDFAGLSKGQLDAAAFAIGTEAGDADDRIIYDSASGALYHDADGVGGAGQVQFAQLPASLTTLGADSILVV